MHKCSISFSQLDKALLCPKCDRFRCICDRPLVSSTSTSTISSSTSGIASANNTNASFNTDSSLKRISRSLANTFGSKDSLDTTTTVSITSSATTPMQDDNNARILNSMTYNGTTVARVSANNDSSLSDISSSRNSIQYRNYNNQNSASSSLNFGTNIFKRFAERMSGNSNLFSSLNTKDVRMSLGTVTTNSQNSSESLETETAQMQTSPTHIANNNRNNSND